MTLKRCTSPLLQAKCMASHWRYNRPAGSAPYAAQAIDAASSRRPRAVSGLEPVNTGGKLFASSINTQNNTTECQTGCVWKGELRTHDSHPYQTRQTKYRRTDLRNHQELCADHAGESPNRPVRLGCERERRYARTGRSDYARRRADFAARLTVHIKCCLRGGGKASYLPNAIRTLLVHPLHPSAF